MTEQQYLMHEFNNLKNQFNLTAEVIEDHFDIIDHHQLQSCDTHSSFDELIDEDLRKNTGSYYTPQHVALFMIKKGLFDYFSLNTSLDQANLKQLFYYNNNSFNRTDSRLLFDQLKSLKVVDLSCGTGVFLINYFELLISILDCLNQKYIFSQSIDFKQLLVNNIYGFDINKTALTITKIRLHKVYFTRTKTNELSTLNLFHMNAITDDRVDECIPTEQFDLVLGNPPYLGEKGNKSLFKQLKTSDFGQQFYEGKMDLFYYFIYRGINSLKSHGILTYITTNYFVTADGAKQLRQFLFNHGSFINIYNFNDVKLFDTGIKIHSLIFSFIKGCDHQTTVHNITHNREVKKVLNDFYQHPKAYTVNKHYLFDQNKKINLFQSVSDYHLIHKIKKASSFKIEDFFNVNQGLVSGADKVTNHMLKNKFSQETIKQFNITKGDEIFVIEDNYEIFKEKQYVKKFYKNSDIHPFTVDDKTDKYILYITDETTIDHDLLDHLSKYKEVLTQRREVQKKTRQWTALQWPRHQAIFENEKIIAPQRAKKNIFGYTKKPFYGSADIYYISNQRNLLNYNLLSLLGYLNSKLIYFYLLNAGKTKGHLLELYATPLKNIPLKRFDQEDQIIQLTKKLINTFDDETFELLNQLIYQEFNLNEQEIQMIETLYAGDCYEK